MPLSRGFVGSVALLTTLSACTDSGDGGSSSTAASTSGTEGGTDTTQGGDSWDGPATAGGSSTTGTETGSSSSSSGDDGASNEDGPTGAEVEASSEADDGSETKSSDSASDDEGTSTESESEDTSGSATGDDETTATGDGGATGDGDETTTDTGETESGDGETTTTEDAGDDAGVVPELRLRDASVIEGDAGISELRLRISIEPMSREQVQVDIRTRPDTAQPGLDYRKLDQRLVIAEGQTEAEVVVEVIADELHELDERLRVELSDAVGATIADGIATATIENDDDLVTGLNARPSNPNCLAGPSPVGDLELVDGFPGVSTWGVVNMRQPPDDHTRHVLAEKAGRLVVVSGGVKQSEAMLDISAKVRDSGEMGLLGFDFHPDYASNGFVYVSYSDSQGDTVVSRFTATDADTLNPASETVILSRDQPATNHNGGEVVFGPDGYLYFGFGDGGSQNDPNQHGQNINTWLSAILRVDVDSASPYAIPPDNPFAGESCNEGSGTGTGCPEIFAWGFRNPWRMSFDIENGDFWMGDVGQQLWEEVGRVELGGNYGWRCREGAHDFRPDDEACAGQTLIDPEFEYDHSNGACAVVGGFVYRGQLAPSLRGAYLFGDSCSGDIWALRDGVGELLDLPKTPMWAFAQDHAGEVYVIAGKLWRFEESNGGGGGPAARLSETGCFDASDPKQAAAGLIPYGVELPFWSDAATKKRWMALPDGEKIRVEADGSWSFPPGTVLAKTMELAGEPVETRLLMRHDGGTWAGYSYEWADDGSDAMLLEDGKDVDLGSQTWAFPSPGACIRCHTGGEQRALGLETAMLNGELLYPGTGITANQLDTLNHIDLLEPALSVPGASQAAMPALDDLRYPLETRARAYLHVNCANCHQPGGGTNVTMDLRFERGIDEMATCGVPPTGDDLGITDPLRLAPGAPERSLLLARAQLRGSGELQMPPIASHLVDTAGMDLLEAWIDSLSDCSP